MFTCHLPPALSILLKGTHMSVRYPPLPSRFLEGKASSFSGPGNQLNMTEAIIFCLVRNVFRKTSVSQC